MNATEASSADWYSIRLVEDDRATRLVLAGALGVGEAAELHRAALDVCARHGRVVVDWSALDTIDTAIAQLLVALAISLREAGRPLDLPQPPPRVEAFLHRTALHPLLFS